MNGRNSRSKEMTLFMKIAFYTLFILMFVIMIIGIIMMPDLLKSYNDDGSVALALSKYLLIPICFALIGIGVGLMALTKLSIKTSRPLGWFVFFVSAIVLILMDSIVAYCIVLMV